MVVLDEVTTEEAQFVLELAYGMGRCAIFMILKFPDEIYTSAIWSSIKQQPTILRQWTRVAPGLQDRALGTAR